MSDFLGVIGSFDRADALRDAAARAREAGLRGVRPYLPVADPSVLDLVEPGGSPVRWVALAGGLTGIAAGLFITIWTSYDYELITGGKPIVAWPPFLVVSFELMILLGVLSSVAGFLWFARLPGLRPSLGYDPSVVVDRFALFIPCEEDDIECRHAERILREAGATEVRPVHHEERTVLQEVANAHDA